VGLTPGRPSGAADPPGPRLLLVEDNERERETMRELLQDEGLDVVGAAADGLEGVALAGELRPDVVLMDLRMPGLDGIEATRRIKAILPPTQVIILTAYADSYLTESAEQVGCYAYLVKGCSPGFVRDVVLQAWRLATGLAERERPSGAASS
jgi:CheY-like chemotaxis protein